MKNLLILILVLSVTACASSRGFDRGDLRGQITDQKVVTEEDIKKALELNADIIIMLHADYQYTPKLIHAMASMIANDVYHVVIGSRILGKGAIQGGMPIYKYIANRFLTFTQNILMNQKLSEYHTGYRAFSKEVFNQISIENNSDDFVFDNPSNTSVRAVSLERVKALFPEGKFKSKRVTLAPPISRRVCQIHPALWGLFNLFPFLRTHKLIFIEKGN